MSQVELSQAYRTRTDKMVNFIHGHIRYTDNGVALSYIKKNFPSCQYTGQADFDQLLLWCEETFENNWIWNFETFYFKHEKDAIMFRLKWSGR